MRVTCGQDKAIKSALLAEPVGRMDANGAMTMQEVVLPRLNEQTRYLLIDMSGVEYLSSAGIGTLIRLLARARQLGGVISVFGCAPTVRQVIRIVAIEPVINVRDDLGEAQTRLRELGAS